MAFLVFWGYFFGIFLGSQNFGPGGIFSVCFVETPARAISGLCSRSGRFLSFTELHAKNVKNGKLHTMLTLLGRGADHYPDDVGACGFLRDFGWPRAVAYFQTKSCKIASHSVAISVFSLVAQTLHQGCRAQLSRYTCVASVALCFRSVALLSRYTPERV